MRIHKELLKHGVWLDPEDTDWLDGDNDKCPIPDRGETDTSDELRDLLEF